MKYSMGIDVSKGKSTISIISLDGEIIEMPFNIEHNKNGFSLLEQKIKNIPKENLKIIMEATGTYHLPIYNFLSENNYSVFVENALKIKKYFDRNLRKTKNDKKDSLKIAEYGCENWYKLNSIKQQSDIYEELRFLHRQYISQVKIQSEYKIYFSNLCDLVFPGYYQLLRENNFILGIYVFKKYYSPSLVLSKRKTTFVNEIDKLAKKLGHRTAGISLANNVYELAKSTFAPYSNFSSLQLVSNSCLDALITTINTTESIISKMCDIAKNLDEYEVVKDLPGIGRKLLPRVISEIGDIRKFSNAGCLIAYAGIDVSVYQSGKFEGKEMHITKRGNKYLRRTLFEISQSVKKSHKVGNDLYDFIIKKELEGKSKKSAKIAGANKFLRIYYGSIKKKYIELGVWN